MERNPNPRMFAINAFRASEFHLKQLSEAQGRFALSLEQAEDRPVAAQSVLSEEIDPFRSMCEKAFPVWKVHRGKVPKTALRNLENDGDWPRGTAATIMKRISENEDLRFELETGHKLP